MQDRDLEHSLLVATVEELLRDELAIREGSGETAYLIFPAEVRRERPDVVELPRASIIYRFDGPVASIYASLAVRLQLSGVFRRTAMWRNAVEYVAPDGGSCSIQVRETHDNRGELSLSLPMPRQMIEHCSMLLSADTWNATEPQSSAPAY